MNRQHITAEIGQSLPGSVAFMDVVPEDYTEARTKFPFLPPPTRDILEHWQASTTFGRGVFVLEYVARIYAGVAESARAAVAAGRPDSPVLVLRTVDHPQSACRPDGFAADQRMYSVWFELDCGQRVDIHMGHLTFAAFCGVMGPSRPFPSTRVL